MLRSFCSKAGQAAVLRCSPVGPSPQPTATSPNTAPPLALCQGAIATRGEGLYEGLDWLSSTLKQMNRGTPPGQAARK